MKCYECGDYGHISPHCPSKKHYVNVVVRDPELEAALGKGNTEVVCIGKQEALGIKDAGSAGNYTTKLCVAELGLKKQKFSIPMARYTCLDQKFMVMEYAQACVRRNKIFKIAVLGVLPKRTDIIMILRKGWLEEIGWSQVDECEGAPPPERQNANFVLMLLIKNP